MYIHVYMYITCEENSTVAQQLAYQYVSQSGTHFPAVSKLEIDQFCSVPRPTTLLNPLTFLTKTHTSVLFVVLAFTQFPVCDLLACLSYI